MGQDVHFQRQPNIGAGPVQCDNENSGSVTNPASYLGVPSFKYSSVYWLIVSFHIPSRKMLEL